MINRYSNQTQYALIGTVVSPELATLRQQSWYHEGVLVVSLQNEEGDKLKRILEDAGFQVIIISDGEGALRTLYQVHPDLVIMSHKRRHQLSFAKVTRMVVSK